jgi:hypothetical protein
MATKRRAHGAAGCSGPTPTAPFTFALQVGALDRASVRAHVCALSDVALRSAAAARRWTVRVAFEAAFITGLPYFHYTGHPRFAAVPIVRERAFSVHF